jgi:hypothetical protein
MSKGSKSRISNQKTFNEGYDRIFNKEDKMSVEKTKKLKEYIWHNHCDMTEEVTVYAESFEKAQEIYLDGEGETYMLEQTSRWDECIQNADDFEDDEETDNECK